MNDKIKRVYIAKFRAPPYGNVFFTVGVSTEPRRKLRSFLSAIHKQLDLSKNLEMHSLQIFSVPSTERAVALETKIKSALIGVSMKDEEAFLGIKSSSDCFASSHYIYAFNYLSGGKLDDVVLAPPRSSLGINLQNLSRAKNPTPRSKE